MPPNTAPSVLPSPPSVSPASSSRSKPAPPANLAILHPPIDETTGFDTEELLTEGQVAILPAGHPLTSRSYLNTGELGDLADLPQPRWPRPDGTYPEGPGPEVQSHSQLLQLIALHRTMMVALESCRSQLREDVVAIPVIDAPASPPS